MAIEDTPDVPDTLQTVFRGAAIQDSFEALVIALHSFLIERDFIPKAHGEGVFLPEKFSGDYYRSKYYSKTCPNVSCEVTYVPLQSQIAVHGVVINSQSPTQTQCIFLTLGSYVNDCKEYTDPILVYKNLTDLSIRFMNGFVYKVLAEMQFAAGVEPTIGLPSLPLDFKFFLFSYLPIHSLVTMSSVNKDFYAIANANFLWRDFYKHDFPDALPSDGSPSTEWKELYKEEFRKRLLKKRQEEAAKKRQAPFYRIGPNGRFIGPPCLPDPLRDINVGVGGWGMSPELRIAFPELARRYREREMLYTLFRRRYY